MKIKYTTYFLSLVKNNEKRKYKNNYNSNITYYYLV